MQFRAEAERYFSGRGISTDTVARFSVGFSEEIRSVVIPYPGDTYYIARNIDTGPNASGRRRIAVQTIGGGAAARSEWEDYEEPSKVAARWVFHREILRLFPKALDVASTADARFDAQVGVGSPAFVQIRDLASKVVHEYIENVTLVQRKPNPYVVGPILVRESEIERFDNALHAGYEGLNGLERTFARALDKTGKTWVRNQSRIGYGIPLISVGETENFYPDFVVWTDTKVVCIDTKGPQILREDAGRKLLSIRPRTDVPALVIRFVTAGEHNAQFERLNHDGYSLWGLKDDGKTRVQHFDTLDDLLSTLVGSPAAVTNH